MTKTQYSLYRCMMNIGKSRPLLYDIGDVVACLIIALSLGITIQYILGG